MTMDPLVPHQRGDDKAKREIHRARSSSIDEAAIVEHCRVPVVAPAHTKLDA